MAVAVVVAKAAVVAEPTRFVLIALVLLSLPSRAIAPEKISAIQEYIAERMGKAKGAQSLREADKKLEDVEKRLLPLLFVFKRTGPALEFRNTELDSLKAAIDSGQFELNPYEDLEWLRSKERETIRVCCVIRGDQRLAQSIQENVARGYPPMSAQTLEQVTNRIREADRSQGSMVDDDFTAPSNDPREIRAGRFRPSGGGGGQGQTPAQKMLNNIGYSPQKPAAEAPAPAPAPAAPGSAPAAPAAGGASAPASGAAAPPPNYPPPGTPAPDGAPAAPATPPPGTPPPAQ